MTANQSLSAEDHAASMQSYIDAGIEKAMSLGNRGPIRLDEKGNLDQTIIDSYWKHGFYVFENVVTENELTDLRADVDNVLSRAPVTPEAELDAQGRPALTQKFKKNPYRFAKPLSDPYGGTKLNNGRHPSQMSIPTADSSAPEWTVQMLDGNLQLMDSALRLYGHPGLLKVAEAINGIDFVPYNEVVFVKEPGLGPSVAWHRDGTNHWDAPDWDQGTHGFNFMTQLFPSTAANCVWVIPGTHKLNTVDIKAMVARAGSDRIEEAVPMICEAGDVMIMNRQLVHGSFANSSKDRRITINAGFFPRNRVLNVTAKKLDGSVHTYTEERIHERSRIISLGIDARKQRFPDEPTYCYQPLAGEEDENRWNEENREKLLKNYNLNDMFI